MLVLILEWVSGTVTLGGVNSHLLALLFPILVDGLS